MRKSMSLKMLFRSPLKTFLTFLLVASASFALFSRVTDYAITMQGIKNIEGSYSCVASLDNEMPDLWYETAVVESRDKLSSGGYSGCQEVPDKPWPSEEKLEEFASLPGVTLADTRYMTAGLSYARSIAAGTLAGLLDSAPEGYVSDTALPAGAVALYYARSSFARAFYDSLEKGSRCLVFATHGQKGGAESGIYFNYENGLGVLHEFNDQRLEIVVGRPLTAARKTSTASRSRSDTVNLFWRTMTGSLT